MRPVKKIISVSALVIAALNLAGPSCADSFYVTPGVGIGSPGSSASFAVGLSCTYRSGAPSVSARFNHTREIGVFVNNPESATELAVLAGLTTIGEDGASAGIHIGLGKVQARLRGDVISKSWLGAVHYETVKATAWGPALQVDTFIKRVGLSFGANFNDSARFWTVLLSVRLGDSYNE